MKKLMKKLTTVFSKKVIDLDNDGKIESLEQEVQGIFSYFTTMKESLLKVNSELQNVIEDELRKQKSEEELLEQAVRRANQNLLQSKNTVLKAENKIKSIDKLQEKVSEFIA